MKEGGHRGGRYSNSNTPEAEAETIFFPSEAETRMKQNCTDKQIAIKYIGKSPWMLRKAHPSLRSDYDVVMAAAQSPYTHKSLQYADESLKSNVDIVSAAVKNHHFAMHFASDLLRQNKEIALTYIRSSGVSFNAAYVNMGVLGSDEDFIQKAVAINASFLRYCCVAFRSRPDIVTLAVLNCRHAFQFADEMIGMCRYKELIGKEKDARRIRLMIEQLYKPNGTGRKRDHEEFVEEMGDLLM